MSTTVLTLAGIQQAQIELAPDAIAKRDAALVGARAITIITDAFEAETAADALPFVAVTAAA